MTLVLPRWSATAWGKVAMHLALNHPQRVSRLAVDMSPVRYTHNFDAALDGFGAVDLATIRQPCRCRSADGTGHRRRGVRKRFCCRTWSRTQRDGAGG